MKYFLQLLGIACLAIFGFRMFGLGEAIITTDAQWLSFLFGGMLLAMIGFFIESYQLKPLSKYQIDNRRKRIRYCWYTIIAILIIPILFLFK